LGWQTTKFQIIATFSQKIKTQALSRGRPVVIGSSWVGVYPNNTLEPGGLECVCLKPKKDLQSAQTKINIYNDQEQKNVDTTEK
jgi:hypothetical protein